MSDLKKKFSRKEWKDCCGKGCKKCEIAQTYIGVYGKSKGLDKLNAGPRGDAGQEARQEEGRQEEAQVVSGVSAHGRAALSRG